MMRQPRAIAEAAPIALQVRGLRKSYGDLDAVRGVDIEVAAGEVFALLGPNGAGKTTIVEILEGHRSRTAGEVRVLGHDPARGARAYRQRVGIVLQQTGVDRFLTVAEVLDQFRGFYPAPRSAEEILTTVGLRDQRNQLVRRLSGGQQRRLDVAVALAGGPELLFLDEPTSGFDPAARRDAWEMIENLAALGTTVFLTTHYMDEAEHLADRVAVIAAGRIVAEGTPAALRASLGQQTTIRFASPRLQLPDPLARRFAAHGETFVASVENPVKTLHELTGWAVANAATIERLEVSPPSLEDAYLALVAQAGQ